MGRTIHEEPRGCDSAFRLEIQEIPEGASKSSDYVRRLLEEPIQLSQLGEDATQLQALLSENAHALSGDAHAHLNILGKKVASGARRLEAESRRPIATFHQSQVLLEKAEERDCAASCAQLELITEKMRLQAESLMADVKKEIPKKERPDPSEHTVAEFSVDEKSGEVIFRTLTNGRLDGEKKFQLQRLQLKFTAVYGHNHRNI